MQMQYGASALGWFLIIPWFIGFGLLSAFKGGSFESIVVFAIIGIWSLAVALYAYGRGLRPFEWLGKFDRSDLKYIAIGFAGLFASVMLFTSAIPGNPGIIVALFFGGIVLAFVLVKSQNILIPILSHILYNFTVVMLATGAPGAVAFANTPLTPVYEFGAITSQDTFAQLVLQTIVGTAEEILKIAITLSVYILVARNVAFAWGLSVAAWTTLHAVQAYKVEINLASLFGG